MDSVLKEDIKDLVEHLKMQAATVSKCLVWIESDLVRLEEMLKDELN